MSVILPESQLSHDQMEFSETMNSWLHARTMKYEKETEVVDVLRHVNESRLGLCSAVKIHL
jgi:hypothetical protein